LRARFTVQTGTAGVATKKKKRESEKMRRSWGGEQSFKKNRGNL